MIYFLVIALCVLALDQTTKFFILRYVQEHYLATREYLTSGNHWVDITYATNTGAAFSIFPNQQKFFIIVTVIALAAILVYLLRNRNLPKLPVTGLAFIFGGATGNLTDRLVHGRVTDFIDFHWNEIYHWPTFNVADSFICIGVALLFLYLLIQENQLESKTMTDPSIPNPELNTSDRRPGT